MEFTLDRDLDNLLETQTMLYRLRVSLDSSNTVGWEILNRVSRRIDAQVKERVTA